MQDFKREFDRYIVIKWEDVGCLTADEQQQLIDFSRRVTSANFSRTGRPWECLVLESHWPEYERAWGMIESRVTGKPEAETFSEMAHAYAEKCLKGVRKEFGDVWKAVGDGDEGRVIDMMRRIYGKPKSLTLGDSDHQRAESFMGQIREEFMSLGMAIVTGDDAEALKLMRQINAISGFTEKNEGSCADKTVEHTSLDTGKVDQLPIGGAAILDRYPGRKDRLIRSSDLKSTGPCDGRGCEPSEQDLKLIREGDYCAEELWGGRKPTCPNCIGKDGDQLPEWAVSRSNGTLQCGLQLYTKDSRRCGNAAIIGFERVQGPGSQFFEVFTVITDAGNRIRATEGEIDELFDRGDYVSDPNEVPGVMIERHRAEQARPAVLARPSGHGPLAWFLAALDHACEQGHDNMMIERGLGNLIAEHINQLETQVERYQRIENTTSVNIDIDASGISPETVEQFKKLSGHVLANMQQAMAQLNPGDAAVMRHSPRTGDAKKSLPRGAVGTNYHMVSAVWREEGEWIEITIAPLASDVYGRARQAGRLSAILAKQHPGIEVVISLLGEKQEAMRGLIIKQILLTSDTVDVVDAPNDRSRIVVVEVTPKKGE